MEELESIIFEDEDGEKVELYVLEQTTLGGKNYLLVVDTLDDEDEDAEAYVMREKSDSNEEYSSYEMVEDDKELEALSKVFEELLEDVNIEV